MLIYNGEIKKSFIYMGQHILGSKQFCEGNFMQEERYTFFKTKKQYFCILVKNGEIINIEPWSEEYNMENIEQSLKDASQLDWDKFLELYQSLRLDTSHYKIIKRLLKAKKKTLEEEIRMLERLTLE